MKRVAFGLQLLFISAIAAATDISWFPQLESFAHATEFKLSAAAPADYQLGLGAVQKIGGRWRFKHEERVQGQLARYTWQVNEGYTAEEGLAWMREQVPEASLLYECQGRSCGSSAQWASLVFQEGELYGHDERQHYVALRVQKPEATYTLVLYAVDRANRKHYVHLDVLRHEP